MNGPIVARPGERKARVDGDWNGSERGRPSRVAIYARVSTQEQAAGYSLEEQVGRLRTLCDERGGKCVRIFREVEGGGSLERPKFERLLLLAEGGAFDLVLVWKVDRLGRSNVDLQNVWAYLKALGIDLVSATEVFDSTTPGGKAMFDMLALFSEWERATIKERAAMGALGRAREGRWHGGPPPHGYKYDPGTGRLYVDPGEAEIVRHVVDLVLERRDLSAAARALRAEGRLTRRGLSWSKPTLTRMLRNPVYVGILRFKDLVARDESLRILSDETFARLQALRTEWSRHRIAAHHRPAGSRRPEREWCRRCGCELAGARAYCSNCGAPQWLPDEDPEPVPADPAPEHAKGDPVG